MVLLDLAVIFHTVICTLRRICAIIYCRLMKLKERIEGFKYASDQGDSFNTLDIVRRYICGISRL